MLLHWDVSATLDNTLERIRSTAVKHQYQIVYEGEFGRTTVLVEWLTVISRQECIDAVAALKATLKSHRPLNAVQLEALITKEGVGQLYISVQREDGEDVEIKAGNVVLLDAMYWRKRTLAYRDTQAMLADVRRDAISHSPSAKIAVPGISYLIGNTCLTIAFNRPQAITYGTFISLLDSIQSFYEGKPVGEVYGILYSEPDGNSLGLLWLNALENIHYGHAGDDTGESKAANETISLSSS